MKVLRQIATYLHEQRLLDDGELAQVLELVCGPPRHDGHEEGYDRRLYEEDWEDLDEWAWLDVERALEKRAAARRKPGGEHRKPRRKARTAAKRRSEPRGELSVEALEMRVRTHARDWTATLRPIQVLAPKLPAATPWPCPDVGEAAVLVMARSQATEVEPALGSALANGTIAARELVSLLSFTGPHSLVDPRREKGAVVRAWLAVCDQGAELKRPLRPEPWLDYARSVVLAQQVLLEAAVHTAARRTPLQR